MRCSVLLERRAGKGSLPFPGIAGSVARVTEPAIADVLAQVGPRLRRLRERRELTLTALAELTGISKSTLSRLETGERKPSLELLLPLSQVFHLPLDELVGAPRVGDPRVRTRPRTRNGRLVYPLSNRPGAMAVWKVVIPPDRERRLRTHAGHEWLYVLSGRLRLILGEEDLTLEAGEVAEFDTGRPHWFGPAGDEPVEILSVHGSHGERPQAIELTKRMSG
jgi:transcriptional regulator with XRE-family HTH domain